MRKSIAVQKDVMLRVQPRYTQDIIARTIAGLARGTQRLSAGNSASEEYEEMLRAIAHTAEPVQFEAACAVIASTLTTTFGPPQMRVWMDDYYISKVSRWSAPSAVNEAKTHMNLLNRLFEAISSNAPMVEHMGSRMNAMAHAMLMLKSRTEREAAKWAERYLRKHSGDAIRQ